jgi:hypothetical protein
MEVEDNLYWASFNLNETVSDYLSEKATKDDLAVAFNNFIECAKISA